jgi:hypothetical protein
MRYADGACRRCNRPASGAGHYIKWIESTDEVVQLLKRFCEQLDQAAQISIQRSIEARVRAETMAGALIATYDVPRVDILRPEPGHNRRRTPGEPDNFLAGAAGTAKANKKKSSSKKKNLSENCYRLRFVSVSGAPLSEEGTLNRIADKLGTKWVAVANALERIEIPRTGPGQQGVDVLHFASRDLRGKRTQVDLANAGANLGTCAAPKLVSAALECAIRAGRPLTRLEMAEWWYYRPDVPRDERNRAWDSREPVPSCESCQVLLPQMLCDGTQHRTGAWNAPLLISEMETHVFRGATPQG